MLELIAQGKTSESRWRKALIENEPLVIGRTTTGWAIHWDEKVSRQHIRVVTQTNSISVEKLPTASNPVYFNGTESESFTLNVGEHFVIGNTTFSLSNDLAFATLEVPDPISQRAFSGEFLRQIRYRDADRRISLLNRLPDIISSSANERELLGKLVNMLMAAITGATSVAICKQHDGEISILRWDQRDSASGNFQPSAGLIAQAIEQRESTLHTWRSVEATANYTIDLQNDWAFVCPLTSHASQGWSIYVTGVNRRIEVESDEDDVQGDIKFTELVAATLDNLRQVRQLERRQSSLRPFFSPIVLDAFVNQDPDQVLMPRECSISVLFCDLRGFTAKTEEMSDQLTLLLSRVSQALGMMTRTVLDFGGVIGDFHGDSAMGFWGWPLQRGEERENIESLASRAAIEIQKQLAAIAKEADHPLKDFRMGLGIATGTAVAGKIGTSEQVKVTAFGPPVNLAARLEGLTRIIGLPILIDGQTASKLDAKLKTRRLGKFIPYGLQSPSQIFELITEDDVVQEEARKSYGEALALFEEKKWSAAFDLLTQHRSTDPATNSLLEFIERHKKTAPDDWNGAIEIQSK